MKVLIITDIEGICGVDNISMIDENTDGYKKACEQNALPENFEHEELTMYQKQVVRKLFRVLDRWGE